ncbi:MAG: hypothetical protein WCT12_12675 [Verrucomicrobiota bacterium]
MMKSLSWRLSLMMAFVALTLSGRAPAVFAAEDDHRGGPGDRLERLEQHVNEMAQRQEQLMRRLGTQPERQVPAALPGREGVHQPMPSPGVGNFAQPMPPGGPFAPATPPFQAAPNALRKFADLVKLCILVGFIFNILVAVWIFTDIRKRGEGSGLFIALALLAGIPAAIIYAIVRIGDKKT